MIYDACHRVNKEAGRKIIKMKSGENRTKQISLRMTEEDYVQFKRNCHLEFRAMADVLYEMIKKRLERARNKAQ